MPVQKEGRERHFFGRWPATRLAGYHPPRCLGLLCAGWSGLMLLWVRRSDTNVRRLLQPRIGGMTGDTLGALNELLEVAHAHALYYPLSRWQMAPGPLVSLRLFW